MTLQNTKTIYVIVSEHVLRGHQMIKHTDTEKERVADTLGSAVLI